MGQGTTPAIPGASLDHASLSLVSTPSIVLGGSLRYRWPPGTSIPAGSVPVLGHSHPASERRASPCRSAGDSLLHLGSRVAAGRGPCSGDEGDLPFPVLTGRRFGCRPWHVASCVLFLHAIRGYCFAISFQRLHTRATWERKEWLPKAGCQIIHAPPPPPAQPATNPRSSPAQAAEPLVFTSPASPSSLSSW